MPLSGNFHITARYHTRSFWSNRPYTKIPDSWQVTNSPADAENWPILQKNIQMLINWKSTSTHVRGLLYKYITDSNQKFLNLVIPKSWKYTILVETHDILDHQGTTCTYCFIKHQYYWKAMNKDIRKYITNCTLCCREKAKVRAYPLQMTEIPDRPFDKIAIDLVTECKTSNSGNRHILTIIEHLTGWP